MERLRRLKLSLRRVRLQQAKSLLRRLLAVRSLRRVCHTSVATEGELRGAQERLAWAAGSQ